MANTGGLIQIHSHNNLDLLQLLTDVSGNLYYNGSPIYTQVSEHDNNAIQKLTDGIFVDGSYFLSHNEYDILTKFTVKDGLLYYDGVVVSQEYINAQIAVMIDLLWKQLEDEYPSSNLIRNTLLTADSMLFITSDDMIFTTGG